MSYVEVRGADGYVGSVGWRCEHASDVEACEQRYAALTMPPSSSLASEPGAVARTPASYVVVERGGRGAFTIVAREAELLTLLGPVDTRGEAMLLAVVRGYHFQSYGPPWRATGRQRGSGWSLTVASFFDDTWSIHLLEVDADGRFRVARTLPLR